MTQMLLAIVGLALIVVSIRLGVVDKRCREAERRIEGLLGDVQHYIDLANKHWKMAEEQRRRRLQLEEEIPHMMVEGRRETYWKKP